jgi:aminoglycoside/choline kinase family phosphotransferase
MTSTDSANLRAWLSTLGHDGPLIRLTGGASPRTFWRLEGTGLLLMVTPPTPPTEHGASAVPTWPRMQRYLAHLGLPVPTLHAVSDDLHLALIDDLGDERLYERVTADPSNRLAAYEKAVDLLVRFQRLTSTPPPFELPVFSAEHLRAELTEFADMALTARLGITLSTAEREVLARTADTLVAELAPALLAHRDFQSQNLMFRGDELVLIDFQDAFLAPAVYDLVALLRDSYVSLSRTDLDHLLARYATSTHQSLPGLVDRFHLQTIQRKLKDSGRFETLARKGKPHFLAFFADSIGYVVEALNASGRFPDLLTLLTDRLPEARARA